MTSKFHKLRVFHLLMLMFMMLPSGAKALEIMGFRVGAQDASTRIVLELSETTPFSVLTLSEPYRAVIDLPQAETAIRDFDVDKGLIAGARIGLDDKTKTRLVFDLRGAVAVKQQFILPPSVSSPYYRLVVDLSPVLSKHFQPQSNSSIPDQVGSVPPPVAAQTEQAASVPAFTPRPRPANVRKVIVIDPGHGGVDPGASGRKAKEKDVVMAFSKELSKQLKSAGYRVHMTRSRDVYIPLRGRVQVARDKKADLFISVHADAIKKKNVRGLSIYTLSEKASDKEAAALARKENQSDIIAGIDFADQPPEIANILIDLAQRETKNLSVKFAESVVSEAGKETKLLQRTHRFAGFRVLRAPDVPSVLIELGFLTNRSDEKQLVSSKWRKRVAQSFVRAVDQYFAEKTKRLQP
ncbi:MAG: N-acetylmuramoyl-L-alanine amidase [Parvibaculales bacterium]